MTSPVDPSQLQLDLDHIRRRRIGQFILVMLATIVGLALVNALFAQPLAVGTLFFAVSALSLALFLLHKRYIDVAGILAALVMFFCIAQAMWTGHGLRSSVLLVYPAALFFVMIMIGKRAFYIAFVAMLIYMTALMTANLQGWRQGPENMTEVRWLLDYTILLTCVAFVIRVLTSDLLALLDSHHHRMHEVTRSKLAAEHLANHDNLTGLPNRRMAGYHFDELLRQSQEKKCQLAVIFVDIDNFKTVNDSWGHQCGDELLKHISENISRQLRRSDKLNRIAGDEFLLLLPDVADTKDLEPVLKKIAQAASVPMSFEDVTIIATISMGIALAPKHGSDFKTLFKQADLALYDAKAAGKNQFCFFNPAA